jgi:methylglutaconyl-CoA hydratase
VSRIGVTRSGGVATIVLADAERRNVLSTALLGELVAAIDEIEHDPDVRVVVLTNDGPVFCAGADLSERSRGTGTDDAPAPGAKAVFDRIRRSDKPYVGRVAGHAVAGGLGLAAALDLSVVLDTAQFGFSEVRLGLAPAVISVVCLPKMRPADAADVFLRGRRFSAEEAVRLGLFNEVQPSERLDEAVEAMVSDLLAGGPRALAATKLLVRRVPTMVEDDAFDWTTALSHQLFTGSEGREGMEAYLEKRPPAWVAPPVTKA